MILRTYARRATRCGGGRSSTDPVLLDSPDVDGDFDSASEELVDLPHFSQEGSSQGRHAAFSSQDSSSPRFFDPFDLPDDPPALPTSLYSPPRGSEDPTMGSARGTRDPAAAVTTTTLLEAQEFGEMMEHVDEVNFSLDGLRPWHPIRVRRASLFSLLSACGTPQQRRLLRVQGMARRIIEAVLDINLDDSPSTVAAAAILYLLANDIQEDRLLESPSCISFLLKLLKATSPETAVAKERNLRFKFLGKLKPQAVGSAYKGLDSTTKSFMSKVLEILSSSKEIKSGSEDDEGIERPELSPKWLALLTMEKACLSTVSFEDTSDMVKMPRGDFKEKLRELGGLDAIFDVLASCHSTLELEARHSTSSFSHLKDKPVLESMLLLLKCLKIMENATFLSKGNQNHLLRMKQKLKRGDLQLSFVEVIINAIKLLSDFSLLQSNSSNPNNEKLNSERLSFQIKPILQDDSNEPSSSHYTGCSGVDRESEVKIIKICNKRQKSSYSLSEMSLSGSGKANDCPASVFINVINRSSGEGCENDIAQKAKVNTGGSRMSSHSQWISIKTSGTTKFDSTSKKPHLLKEVKCNSEVDMHDPFAFDEGELGPSKWEMLANKKENIPAHEDDLRKKENFNGFELPNISADVVLSQLTDEKTHKNCAKSHSTGVDEDLSLVEDCLLTSVKVLMNLTNDNRLGCQQVAACGGLHTIVSLIISHFPSFDCCFGKIGKQKESALYTKQSNDGRHPNKKQLNDYELDLLVALLGLLVNLVEKDSQNRLHLAAARISSSRPGKSESSEAGRDVIQLLCSIFLANQGNEEAKDERTFLCDDEESLLQGAKEAEMMIIEAYAALLLGFLSIESCGVREAIAKCLPNRNLQVLVPVLERFVAFHLSLNMITPETHAAVLKVIQSCKGS